MRPLNQKKLRIASFGLSGLKPNRNDILFVGIIILLIGLVAVAGRDGYLFFKTNVAEKNQEKIIIRPISITKSDLEETMHLLDKRQEEFNKILGVSVKAPAEKK